MQILLSAIIAYLIGSVSSAILVSKLLRLQDPRNAGSGNPGATNVLRLSGKIPAVLTLLGDIAKGTLPVVAASAITQDPVSVAIAALAAFLGHLYPVYFRFSGGKVVATAIGAYLGLSLPACLGVVGVWLTIALISRYSSLSSILAMLSAPFFIWYFGYDEWIIGTAVVIFVFIVSRHIANIKRLLAGEESRINLSKS